MEKKKNKRHWRDFFENNAGDVGADGSFNKPCIIMFICSSLPPPCRPAGRGEARSHREQRRQQGQGWVETRPRIACVVVVVPAVAVMAPVCCCACGSLSWRLCEAPCRLLDAPSRFQFAVCARACVACPRVPAEETKFADVAAARVDRITTATPVEDFKAMMARRDDPKIVRPVSSSRRALCLVPLSRFGNVCGLLVAVMPAASAEIVGPCLGLVCPLFRWMVHCVVSFGLFSDRGICAVSGRDGDFGHGRRHQAAHSRAYLIAA